ncbi:MAG TPA: hypothetical protein VJ779_04695 [Acetobacteraceae bacterium]|nr:hypothetical protein [Acetobacteraceae bacterium]
MPNPWMKKNPALSLFLSGANAWAGAARGVWMREARRQRARATKAGLKGVAACWASALSPPASAQKKGKRKR